MDDRWYMLIRNVIYGIGGLYGFIVLIQLLDGFFYRLLAVR